MFHLSVSIRCLSFCFHSIFWTDWPLTLTFCMYMGHDHDWQCIQGQGQIFREFLTPQLQAWPHECGSRRAHAPGNGSLPVASEGDSMLVPYKGSSQAHPDEGCFRLNASEDVSHALVLYSQWLHTCVALSLRYQSILLVIMLFNAA